MKDPHIHCGKEQLKDQEVTDSQASTYSGVPSISSMMTACRLQSTGLGTGNPWLYRAFMYANSFRAARRDR